MNPYPYAEDQHNQHPAIHPVYYQQHPNDYPPPNAPFQVHPPERAYSRNGQREDLTTNNFNFELQQQHQQPLPQQSVQPQPLQQHSLHHQPLQQHQGYQQDQQAQNMPQQQYQYQYTPTRADFRRHQYDSRTNSEIYPESFTSPQFDSRYGSEANLLRSGSATPSWGGDTRIGSQLSSQVQVGQSPYGDFRDFREQAPNVSLSSLQIVFLITFYYRRVQEFWELEIMKNPPQPFGQETGKKTDQ
jgi:hypothetical protein